MSASRTGSTLCGSGSCGADVLSSLSERAVGEEFLEHGRGDASGSDAEACAAASQQLGVVPAVGRTGHGQGHEGTPPFLHGASSASDAICLVSVQRDMDVVVVAAGDVLGVGAAVDG